MYNALTDRQTDRQTTCRHSLVSNAFFVSPAQVYYSSARFAFSKAGVFCTDSLREEGYFAHPEHRSAVFYPTAYLCRVIGFSGEAAFVVAEVRARERRFCGSTVLCVPGVRAGVRPVVPSHGAADAFREPESGVAA